MDILNQVFNEDCLIGMKRIPTGSVDLILCDLPYGTIDCAWDVVIPFEPLWAEYERIIKDNGAIILTASQPFTTDLINSKRKLFRYELIWEKTKASGFLNARKMPNKCHENVVVFYKKPPTYNPIKYKLDERFNAKRRAKEGGNMGKSHCFRITGKAAETYQYKEPENGERFPDSILCFKSESGKGMHPTQKPVAMFEWLIKTYTNEGEVVLDNCMGRGTTAIAAINSGRNFIGFETDKKYYKQIQENIDLAYQGIYKTAV